VVTVSQIQVQVATIHVCGPPAMGGLVVWHENGRAGAQTLDRVFLALSIDC
jgi:hypothetical protein